MAKSSKARLGLWLLVGGLSLLYVGYVASSAVFLNSRFLKSQIDSNPESLNISYDFAISPLPCLVWVWGGAVRVQDPNIQMWFRLDSAAVMVDPKPLFRKEFHALSVNGSKTTFHFRLRRKPPTKKNNPDRILAALPEIPGLVPVKTAAIEKAENEKSEKKADEPWKLRFSQVHVSDLEEIWIEQYHFKGRVQVDGGFYLYPSKEAEVYPAHIRIREGSVYVGESLAMDEINADIKATIDRFQGDKVPNLDILNYVTGDINFKSDIRSLVFGNYYLAGIPWLKLGDAEGKLDTELKMDHSRLKEGSHLQVKAKRLQAHLWEQVAVGEGDINWEIIKQPNEADLGKLLVHLHEFELKDKRRLDSQVTGRDLQLELASPNLDFRKSLSPLEAKIDLGKLHVSKLTAANVYIPRGSGLKFDGGTADLWGKFTASTLRRGQDSGWLKLISHDAKFVVGKVAFVSDIEAGTELKSGSMEMGKFELIRTELKIDKLNSVEQKEGTKDWSAKIVIPEAQVSLQPHSAIKASAEMKSTNARPLIMSYLALTHTKLPGWIMDLLTLENFTVSMKVEAGQDSLKVSKLLASGGHFGIKGWLTAESEEKDGRFLIEYPPLAAGIDLKTDGAHVRIQDAYGWYKQQPH